MKTFGQHLRELRLRLSLCLLVLSVGSCFGYGIHKPVEAFLQKPLGQTLYYTTVGGGLSLVMQVSIGIGVLIALPLLLFQIMQFARPAVKPVRTKQIIVVTISSFILTILGIIYAYYVSLPAALHFLVSFTSPGVKAWINVSDYLKFLFAYLVGTVIAFQLPLVFFFTNKIHRFPPGTMRKIQQPAIIGAVIVAGIITPTVDPINQMLVAIPIIALFEVGTIAVLIDNRMHKPLPKFEIKRPSKLEPYFESEPTPAPATPRVATVPRMTTAPQPVVSSVAPVAATSAKPRTVIMDVMTPSLG